MRCRFLELPVCVHPSIRGPIEPGRCDGCEHYSGPPRGMGDVVHTVARVTGVGALVHAAEQVSGKSCGCAERRAAMNQAIPFDSAKGP